MPIVEKYAQYSLPEEGGSISQWCRMHRDYLIKKHNPIRFNNLRLGSVLWAYLADIHEQAQSHFELMIEQMKSSEGITEQLKASNQMVWVARMDNIHNRATEIVNNYMICN